VINLHGLDVLNLTEVRLGLRHCIQERRTTGETQVAMAAKNGHGPDFMRVPWDDLRFPWEWHWSTLRDLCDGAGVRAKVDFWNLAMPKTPLYEMGLINNALLGVGALESLRKAREDMGLSHQELGRLMGIVKSGVYKIENGDDPKLSSIMRYARALGGRAVYGIEEPA
jgi:DNA-binding XRE family transcriptional regulator